MLLLLLLLSGDALRPLLLAWRGVLLGCCGCLERGAAGARASSAAPRGASGCCGGSGGAPLGLSSSSI